MGEFQKEVAAVLPWRKGHFTFESGHHGDTWLNLELLCLQPEPVEQLAAVLADCLSEQKPDVVCGPLVEGAFVALMVARRLKVPLDAYPKIVAIDATCGKLSAFEQARPENQPDAE